jgi:hypothetical protein
LTLWRLKVTSKGLQEINRGGQPAETISVAEPPKEPEETDRLFSPCRRLRNAFGNRLRDSRELFRLDAPQNAAAR